MVYVPRESVVFLAAVVSVLLAMVTVLTATHVHGATGTGFDHDCGSLFDVESSTLYLPAAENTMVIGESNWAPDAEVSLALRFHGSPNIILRNDSVVIDQHGRWEAAVNLSGVEEGRRFVAVLHHDNEVVDSVEGEVGSPTATVTFENQTSSRANTVTIQWVHLETGGFVAVHRDSAHGPIVGVTEHLEPGPHRSVTIELDTTTTGPKRLVAMPHKDTDCNTLFGFVGNDPVDGPYVENETAVVDAATVRLPTPTPSATPTPTPSGTLSATPTRTSSPSPSPTDPAMPTTTPTRTATTGPGFGIGAALIAISGGLLFLWRHG